MAWLAMPKLDLWCRVPTLGAAPNWLPTANSVLPTLYADFTTENTTDHYWFNGAFHNFLSWVAGLGGTFARTSNAMMYDSTGKLTYAPNNQLLQSNIFTNVAWSKSANFTVTGSAGISPTGANNATSLATANGVNQESDLAQNVGSVGVTQMQSVYAKANGWNFLIFRNNTQSGFANVSFNLGTGALGTVQAGWSNAVITSVGNGWYRCSAVWTPAGLANQFIPSTTDNTTIVTGDGVSGILVYGAQIEAVTYQTTPSTYTDTTSAAFFGPRFDYDPVALTPKGLLLEGARTNLALQSNQFDTTWTLSSVAITVGSAAGTSPDGTNNAWKLNEATVTNTVHTVTQAFAKAASALAYSFAVYAKVGVNRTRIELQLNDNAGNGAFSVFDLAGGQIGVAATGLGVAFTALSSTITSVGNGWYRCVLMATSNTAVALNALMGIDSGTGVGARSNSYVGVVGDTILAFGAQLEQASFASTYIPTTTASVTRAADSFTFPWTETTFSAILGMNEYTPIAFGGLLSTDGSNEMFGCTAAGLTNVLSAYGPIELDHTFTFGTTSTARKLGIAGSQSARSLTASGDTVSTDANAITAVGKTTMYVGSAGGTSNVFGHYTSLGLWPAIKISDSELVRLTT